MPTHHVTDETLLAYSSAALPAHVSVVVAAHLQMCPDCRRNLYFLDALGGALLARVSQGPAVSMQQGMSSHAARDMWARIGADQMALSDAPVVAAGEVNTRPDQQMIDADPDMLPRALWPAFGQRYSALEWETVAPGVDCIAGTGHPSERLRIMRIDSQADLPAHVHFGNELTLVLKGSYVDALGRFASGDIADLDESVRHAPVVEPGEICIAVVATHAA